MKSRIPNALRNYVVHATSWRGYWAILASGEITPNTGHLHPSYYRTYYCKEIGGVSLLHMPMIVEACVGGRKIDSDWLQVLSFHKPFTILMALREEALRPNLKMPDDAEPGLGYISRPFMSPGEICHVGPISTSLIERVFLSIDYQSVFDATESRFSKQEMVSAANRLRSAKRRSLKRQSTALSAFYIPSDDFSVVLTIDKLEGNGQDA